MPLELHESSGILTGVVTVDEVEQLATWLRATPKARLNLRRCNHLHTGALQLLLLFRPKVTAAPTEAFLATRVLPLLEGGNGSAGRKEPEPP
ncbi:MAG: hypothetical protein ABW022_25945 [Actinoplanes sp.]